jgi:hypothetical protein
MNRSNNRDSLIARAGMRMTLIMAVLGSVGVYQAVKRPYSPPALTIKPLTDGSVKWTPQRDRVRSVDGTSNSPQR